MAYSPSTRARMADLTMGLHTQTAEGILLDAHFTNPTQTELFNFYGRIAILQLYIEVTTAFDVNATTVAFNVTHTVPAAATINVINAASASCASLSAGSRIVCVGGVVATQVVVTAKNAASDVTMAGKKVIIGCVDGAGIVSYGTIGFAAAGATQAGTCGATAHIYWAAMSPGAYVTSIL